MREKKVFWVAYTNTDLTEGRGQDVPIAICAIEQTAKRLAKNKYTQGSDGPVREMELVYVGGEWYVPSAAIRIVEPSKEDLAAQAATEAKRLAVKKAIAAGLTDADLMALGIKVTK